MSSTHVLAVANQKGGVAKTTTVASLGAALADVSRIVRSGVGAEVVTVDQGDWDMHTDLGTLEWGELKRNAGDLAGSIAAFFADLGPAADRVTLVTLSEFGRTPAINKDAGRDHFASAWSCTFTGCGVRGGTVHGKTDADGQTVAEGKANAGDVLATLYKAVGIDPSQHYYVGPRPVPLAPEDASPIATVLA